ncbi:hypothetical protein [Fimbriimonas ginsengisoli]|uniref:Hypervirulence associated protein TUDOR domain-containing protein n=1 Tax=Fimbriimonas ginsengisoli Gsoil 348 TaxID=661478 RepID=A0A068NNQ0_FIMGI|nr:hypothetical protein [Fimbriimonas ginsengisoli]AIE85027.1 hypothetical protein OP10G_1659 [Fimbriimonas ginsengisoli Gsoil 348]
MGKKITERATGQIWTVMGDTEGHNILRDDNPPTARPKSYRIKNEATGEERLIGSDISARFEGNF